MSHYAVAVIHRGSQDVDELLAPYSENLEVEPYVRFTKQEAIDYVREHWLKDGETKTDDECWKMMADDYSGNTDDEGNIYTTYNPDSKWDWYEEGGRFSDLLRLKDSNEKVNSALIADIDFTADPEEYKDALRFWDVVVDHQPQKDGEDIWSIYNEEYYKKYYGDRENYARQQSSFSTYAVVTPDGEWHGKGEMGWFGCSSETPEESNDWANHYMDRFINSADNDLYITIIDCHI